MASLARTSPPPLLPGLELGSQLVVLCEDGPASTITLKQPGQDGSLGRVVTLIISVSTMKKHCSVFDSLNLKSPLPCNKLRGHELFLRILHDRTDKEEHWDRGLWTVGFEDIQGVLEACTDWGAEPKILRHFVSFWLAAKNPAKLNPGELSDSLKLCDIVGGLDVQKQCFAVALGELSFSILPSKIWHFPPVLALTDKQSGTLVFAGELARWDYGTMGFSPRFTALYGRPTKYYSDFHRFMMTKFSDGMAPRYSKFSFKHLIEGRNFLRFMKSVQNTAKQLGQPVLNKAEVEAGWVKCLMSQFDRHYLSNGVKSESVPTEIFENAKEALSVGVSQNETDKHVAISSRNRPPKILAKNGCDNNLSEIDIMVKQDGCDERPEDLELPDEWQSSEEGNNEDMMEGVIDGSQMYGGGDGLQGLQQDLGHVEMEDDFADMGLTSAQALEVLREEYRQNQANKEY